MTTYLSVGWVSCSGTAVEIANSQSCAPGGSQPLRIMLEAVISVFYTMEWSD
jgi:hypothetical protein